ncbi:hypothetical protein IP88_12405 [alpha proteobacterium AAP81b]|nr:hypothetical protein IP88_12405 [alpha proteobacterium AAP81b]
MIRLTPLAAALLSGCNYAYPAPPSRPAAPSAFTRAPAALAAATPAQVALGRALFHDTRLSGDGSLSCASCHQPELGFGDGRATGVGIGGTKLKRHTPGLWNVGFAPALFVDGRAATLEEQALMPVANPDEMGADPAKVAARLAADPAMRARFAAAFPGGPAVTPATMARAIAAYERTMVSGAAPFDRWAAGSAGSMAPAAVRGYALFAGRAGCARCHNGWALSDGKYHDVGLPDTDPGRGAITGRRRDDHAFRTPSLREIGRAPPYMHDGSLPSLAAVVDHYADGVVARRGAPARVALTAAERRDLVAFLEALDSDAVVH